MKLPVNYDKTPHQKRREVREAYIILQKGLCQHCNEPLSSDSPESMREQPINKALFPKGFFEHPIHLHHNHNTGMTIGAVHCYCNAYLWQYLGE